MILLNYHIYVLNLSEKYKNEDFEDKRCTLVR